MRQRLHGQHGRGEPGAGPGSEHAPVAHEGLEHLELARPEPLLGRVRRQQSRPKVATQLVPGQDIGRQGDEMTQGPSDRRPVPELDERPHARVVGAVELEARRGVRGRRARQHRESGAVLGGESAVELLRRAGCCGGCSRGSGCRRKKRHDQCQGHEGSHEESSRALSRTTLRPAPVPRKGRRGIPSVSALHRARTPPGGA